MSAPETVTVSLPHGLSAVYILRPLTVPPLPIPTPPAPTSKERRAAVQQSFEDVVAGGRPDGCPF